MKLSFWNQKWTHEEVIELSSVKAYSGLLEYYKQSSKSFYLKDENEHTEFSFHRGNSLFSIIAIGSELLLKHYVKVKIEPIDNACSKISWDIDMKLFGLQAGKNAIIEECKKICSITRR